ncbi:nascent polypeptide-associated complex subunit alpha, muscle-specific form-like [Falco biarmicus]|uniref:nascent polypeptide-associated complex subunit alpha, muscle-specific form-like n=1 Tax=Falco rusticolus TaxID=120794 RepID=UPI0018867D87|nr:nascent polypeptide-associated complex subunit alpha, muscle-specific form-like [Falco rusticolus]XP_055582917.1 nascent polypeptide-associated complex subunit alpha, muscle-specific form-like [Falco cherrug]XP_056217096.1 nascent polypeptide-associated complex subunit alpha, muscle-specific form-like [Falco biarmicus]
MPRSGLSSTAAAGAGYGAARALRAHGPPTRDPSVAGSLAGAAVLQAGQATGPTPPPVVATAHSSPVTVRLPSKAKGSRGPAGPSPSPAPTAPSWQCPEPLRAQRPWLALPTQNGGPACGAASAAKRVHPRAGWQNRPGTLTHTTPAAACTRVPFPSACPSPRRPFSSCKTPEVPTAPEARRQPPSKMAAPRLAAAREPRPPGGPVPRRSPSPPKRNARVTVSHLKHGAKAPATRGDGYEHGQRSLCARGHGPVLLPRPPGGAAVTAPRRRTPGCVAALRSQGRPHASGRGAQGRG